LHDRGAAGFQFRKRTVLRAAVRRAGNALGFAPASVANEVPGAFHVHGDPGPQVAREAGLLRRWPPLTRKFELGLRDQSKTALPFAVALT